MPQQPCLTLIQNLRPRMTEVERKVADCILADSARVVHMTASQLAARAGVAPSGVIRFCKSLGYAGFSDLKISLARTPEPGENRLLPAVEPTDGTDEILEKVFGSSVNTLRDTLAMFDRAGFAQAVDWMHDAARIEFYGVGTSSTIAADAYYRIMRIGYPAFYATDSSIMRTSASALREGMVAVGISHCGATIDTIEALRLAKKGGATTIALTSCQDSPITRCADLTLTVYSDEARYAVEAVSARIAHIAVLDAICVALSMREYERTKRRLETLSSLLAPQRVSRTK